jgi:dihydroorotate dehydrogenase electron transfer subunit
MRKNEHTPFRISRIEQNSEDIRTFELESMKSYRGEIRPGQYAVLWLPGVSENPFSFYDDNPLRFMIRRVGNEDSFTSHMFRKKEGDEVFVSGPYGNSFLDFRDPERFSYVIAGGIGIAPLNLLLKGTDQSSAQVWLGYRTRDEMAIPDNVLISNVYAVTTEDGSVGQKGLVTDLFDRTGIGQGPQFFICGPERMMLTAAEKALDYAEPDNIILSVERYMKCLGQGICGHCGIRGSERSYLTCIDGPVFSYEQLRGGDLGRYARTSSGKRLEL